MRAYKGVVGKAPCILTVNDDGECWAVRPQPRYPRGKSRIHLFTIRLSGPQRRGRCFLEDLPLQGIELQILCVVQNVAWSLNGPPRPSRSFVWRPLIGTHWIILVSNEGFGLSCCWEICCNTSTTSTTRSIFKAAIDLLRRNCYIPVCYFESYYISRV